MSHNGHERRCSGCLGDFNPKEPVAQVMIGSYVTKKGERIFRPKKGWGEMHERCFLIAIGDPQGVEMMTQSAASHPG